MILGRFRAVLSYLANSSTTFWTCTKSQKLSLVFSPVFLSKKRPSFARLFTKMSPSEELGTLVIGDIFHYFALKSSKLSLFFIFRHYSLFFQKYENNVIISLQISKLWLFSQLFLWNPIFLKERLAHKALGLLLTAQSAFERDMGSQGSFKHCFSILQQWYDTFCCENLYSALIPFRHYFWEKKDIIHQKTLSSRPEKPKAGPKIRNLEVGALHF